MKGMFICVMIGLMSTSMLYAALPKDIIFYMDFDEGAGGSVKDKSGNKSDGKINGAKWVKGKNGMALEFSGKEFVNIPTNDTLKKIKEPMSIGAWVLPKTLNSWTNIVEMDADPRPKAWKVGFQDNRPVFTTYGIKDHTTTGTVPLNKWSHVAYTYDAKFAKIYINGKLDSEIPGSGNIDVSNEKLMPSLDIGYRRTSNSSFLDATLDELWISNIVRNEAEIKELMDNISALLSVDPAGKLTTSWGTMKDRVNRF